MPVAVITACLFALTGVCATQAARALGGSRANFFRLLIALVLLGLWAHLFSSGFASPVLGWFMLAGGIGFGLGGWCVFQALPRIGSTLTLLIVECAAAISAATFSWIFLGAALTTSQVLFALLTLAGVTVGMAPKKKPDFTPAALRVGTAMALLAALAQGLSFTLSRHAFTLLRAEGLQLDRLTAAYHRLLGGAVVALAFFLISRIVLRHRADSTRVPLHTAPPVSDPARRAPAFTLPAPAWVFLNALFGPVLGVSSMLWAISLVGNPGIVQAIASTSTLLTVPLAWYLERTKPGWNYYLGCLLALAGATSLILFTRS